MNPRQRIVDPTQVQTTSFRTRRCRLYIDMLAKTPDPNGTLQEFYRSLPRMGVAREVFAAADALAQAALRGRAGFWIIDETAIEAGLSPLLVNLIQHGLIRGVIMTGTAALRDYELAYFGKAGEELEPGIQDGLLGMSREIGEGLNTIVNEGVKRGFGLGECLGRGILDRQPRFYTESVLAACAARLIPCTVHATLGAEGFHRHPMADGQMLGKGSLKDMHLLSTRLEGLDDGGVLVDAAVDAALQGVVIQAAAMDRNLGGEIDKVTLIRFHAERDWSALRGVRTLHHIPGPIEIMLPIFAGVLFSLVE